MKKSENTSDIASLDPAPAPVHTMSISRNNLQSRCKVEIHIIFKQFPNQKIPFSLEHPDRTELIGRHEHRDTKEAVQRAALLKMSRLRKNGGLKLREHRTANQIQLQHHVTNQKVTKSLTEDSAAAHPLYVEVKST